MSFTKECTEYQWFQQIFLFGLCVRVLSSQFEVTNGDIHLCKHPIKDPVALE